MDADLVLVEENTMEIDTVIARGEIMVQDGKAIRKGTFQ